ncbi:hypothetical protein TRFO_37798 [Tritrichomonas foetus]|uniref:Uncharacterized protein n=1 Tax=Tritrichomonas foetus TaxID=1144522 RepID=A0A1J4JFV2_9EUKA|nr:hypothetical protein TRFO_37798 [Tritrichomonas foetus]|eukprot:OHS96092.1 hypothetical protein TRFO_37798 [Tritrichomonas foetus]
MIFDFYTFPEFTSVSFSDPFQNNHHLFYHRNLLYYWNISYHKNLVIIFFCIFHIGKFVHLFLHVSLNESGKNEHYKLLILEPNISSHIVILCEVLYKSFHSYVFCNSREHCQYLKN